MRQDLHTYRALRRTHLKQRKFWMISETERARYIRITGFLGDRAKYAKSLVNGRVRYNQYGEITQIGPRP